jgi:hypothetical protein
MNGLDLYRQLKKRVQQQNRAQCVSNAWLKMYELCWHYRLLSPSHVRTLRLRIRPTPACTPYLVAVLIIGHSHTPFHRVLSRVTRIDCSS